MYRLFGQMGHTLKLAMALRYADGEILHLAFLARSSKGPCWALRSAACACILFEYEFVSFHLR